MSATAAKESPFQTLKEMEKPEPKALAELLESVRSFLCRYIAFPTDAHATAISLWIVHTWAIEAFDYTPYLSITSPVKRCGKSRLLDCLRALCRKAWAVISPTEAVLYRKIEADCPTLLLDEVYTICTGGKGDDSKEGLRALLNAGFERRATVPRCVGPKHDLQEFRVFCPKALAGIGKLPDTVADRSLPVIQARRAKGQNVQRFRARDALPIAQPIMEALQSWSETPDVIATLSSARPAIPNELGDRASDICEPLLAIADMAGGMWPDLARRVLVQLCAIGEAQDDHIGTKLLAAMREIFQEKSVDRPSTRDVLDALIARENDDPWAAMWERDVQSGNVRGPAAKLARLLKPFGISAGTIRESDGSTPKGYKLESFEDAFSRYLPQNPF